ncbi:aldo/keto reductase [Rhizorhabdus argentea]|uniref:aldo/keto reductase n=1 Tax=Rhizorhabdus argentea TaxID=1387174 RepID=UPI0030EE4C09
MSDRNDVSAEPRLSRLGLGCARIGSFNNPQSLSESRALVARAIEMGVTTIDTSNIYGQGDSERQIGLALRGRRELAFLVTKTGKDFSGKMKLMRLLKPLLRPLLAARKGGAGNAQASGSAVTARRAAEMREDWRPEAFRPSLEASLKRLETDRVDGLLLHSPPAAVAADPAVGAALAALKAAGKLRHFGVSCDDKACLVAALTMPGLSLLQLPWNVIADLDDETACAIRERGILVLAREVIRLQPGVTAVDAVRGSTDHPLVTSALIGTTSTQHLTALAAMFAKAKI